MGKSRKKDLLIFISLFLVTVLIVFYAMFLFYKSFQEGEETFISYDETSDLGYKVLLKENDFYSDEYIGEEYNLIASSIDEIKINFAYLLTTSDYVQGSSYYTINAKIIAYQKNDVEERKVWDYEKLIRDKAITLYDIDTTTVKASDTFTINYQEYKSLMDSYQKKYAVSLVGKLMIEIDIKSDLTYQDFQEKINLEPRKMSITIPLTDQIVKITKQIPEDSSKILIEKGDTKINYVKLILSLFPFFGGIALCIFLAKVLVNLLGYDSQYAKKLNKILRSYNSIIVNVDKPSFPKSQKITMVSDFEELLDAQSELRVPILYCNEKPNVSSMFYLKYDNDVLAYELQSDLYNCDTKKKSKSDKYEKKG